MSVKDQWRTAGLTTVTLPSGFRVRGTMPNPSEVIRRKIVPQALRMAVIQSTGGGRMLSDLNEDEHAALVDARRYQAAAFIREMAAPGTTGDDGWEPVVVTKDDLEVMPPADVEALDDLIGGYRTANGITIQSERALGIVDDAAVDAVEQAEAGDTVDGWRDFRVVTGGDGVGADGADVAPTAVDDARHPEPVDRVPRRRRARTPDHRKGATDDRPGATA